MVVVATTSFSRMAQRATRNTTAGTARDGALWSHYLFRQRLLSSAERRPGCVVIQTGEAHTTRTCGNCGRVNEKVGVHETFVCVAGQANRVEVPGCGSECDRDVHAARNIWLRVVTDTLREAEERGEAWVRAWTTTATTAC